jgi:hypothetical protein
MIAWAIYVTFGGALLLLFLPNVLARWMALLSALTGFAISLDAFVNAGDSAGFQTIVKLPWIRGLGFEYHLAADGISLTMCLVTGLTAVSAVLFSWDVEERPNEFFFWLLLVVGGSYGVFLSADLFLLFVFYELVIVPKYFLIAIWGSTNKEYGAMKLTLYSFFGGALALIGIVAIYVTAGANTLDLHQLAQMQFTQQFQNWVFPLLFLGFAVLAGIWPFHTWAPTGHVAAPTAGSMLLAGIVMKLGAYGALRVAMNLMPLGFQTWSKWILALGLIGIVYAAGVALRQRDLKFVIGYSSEPHGFCFARARQRECPRRQRRGPANVFARRDCRPPLRRGRTHDLSPHSYARVGCACYDEPEPSDAVRSFFLRYRVGRFDGHPGLQRVRRRNHDPPWGLEGVSDGGLRYRRRYGAGRGVYASRFEEDIFQRRSDGRSNATRPRPARS